MSCSCYFFDFVSYFFLYFNYFFISYNYIVSKNILKSLFYYMWMHGQQYILQTYNKKWCCGGSGIQIIYQSLIMVN